MYLFVNNLLKFLQLIVFISNNNNIVSNDNPIKSILSYKSYASINSNKLSNPPIDNKYPSLKYVNYPKKYAASTLNSL